MFFVFFYSVFCFKEDFNFKFYQHSYSFVPFGFKDKGHISLHLESEIDFELKLQLLLLTEEFFPLYQNFERKCSNIDYVNHINFTFQNKKTDIILEQTQKNKVYYPLLIKCDNFGEDIKGTLDFIPKQDFRSYKVFYILIFSLIIMIFINIYIYFNHNENWIFFISSGISIITFNVFNLINYFLYYQKGNFILNDFSRFYFSTIYLCFIFLLIFLNLEFTDFQKQKIELIIFGCLFLLYSLSFTSPDSIFYQIIPIIYFLNVIIQKKKKIEFEEIENKGNINNFLNYFLSIVIITFIFGFIIFKSINNSTIFFIEFITIIYSDLIFIILYYLNNKIQLNKISTQSLLN